MYFPYFRGKQNELLLLREKAELISSSQITPIIEPVKKNIGQIKKCISALIENNAEFILIANPKHGDFSIEEDFEISEIYTDGIKESQRHIFGYILDEKTTVEDVITFVSKHTENKVALIHYGFSNGVELGRELSRHKNITHHIFIEDKAQKRYRKNFRDNGVRALIRDGFTKRSNKDYPKKEHFSELHIMYDEEGMDGFGDFLITGDDYSESGGPAYAVAIHLTYTDSDDEDDMFINHYISDRNKTAADPGGKFLEALEKLIEDVKSNENILITEAVEAYKKLNENKHYPGLGSVKKLSMQHHIELMADFLAENK
jgi:hypothetical protein